VEVISTLGRGSTFTITLPDDAEPVGPEETIAS
jgi:signal transduction histidine kinase